ncbi:MAG TPA: BamA/TamA family outer membrane protein [Gemmatimonadales bacterium]|nr:BamA/TamA family outer membrane protein [Gemmatimonadales bacterium]
MRGPVFPAPEYRIPSHPRRYLRPWPRLRVAVGLLLLGGAVTEVAAQEPQRVIRGLSFRGNAALSDEALAAAIGTTKSSFFATSPLFSWLGLGEKRYFDELEFRRDVLRLAVLYKRTGFPDVQVDTIVRRDERNVRIDFAITEGRPILVTGFAVNGLDSLPRELRERVLVDLPLRPSDVFNRYLMQISADTVGERLRNRGYPTASVFTGFESNRETYTASVTFDVVPGEPAVFGQARVEGAERLDTAVVRDLLFARPGRPFSQADLVQSQRNLYKTDLVRSVAVGIDSAGWEPGADSVPLLVRLSESRPYRVRAGVGYATTECFRTSAAFTTRNFLGKARTLDLTGQLSRIGVGKPFDLGLRDNICGVTREDTIGSARVNYQLRSTVRRPAFLGPPNTLLLTLFAERRSEFKVYRRDEIGASVEIQRESPRARLPVSLSYTLSYGKTQATPVSFCAFFNACTPEVINQLRQRRILAALSGRVSFPRANSLIDPTRGYNATVEITHASKPIGSSSLQQFTRLFGDAAWYRPLSRDIVLSWRVRGGVIFSPGVAIGTGVDAFVPPEQRFYAGGPNDVRGFSRNEMGPVVYVVRDSTLQNVGTPEQLEPDSVQVAPTGGNTLAVGNVELRFPAPIFRSTLRLAAFLDAGALWERGRSGELSRARVRFTPGFGFRIGTPLGPARLDLAYNGYALPPGPLFVADTAGNLQQIRDQFSVDRRGRVLGVPLTFQFSVGQAF